MYCMDIFHYVADQLKTTPLFTCSSKTFRDRGKGAVYNDFDFDSSQLATCSTKTSAAAAEIQPRPTLKELVPQKLVDYAILHNDNVTGADYAALAIDTEYQDCASNEPDEEYMRKVYKIVTEEWRNLEGFTEETVLIYERRQRCDWTGPDAVYDAYLLSNNERRTWFPYERFLRLFPSWDATRLDIYEKYIHEKEQAFVDFEVDSDA